MPLPEKCRNLLTICRKAGKLEAGFARAKDAIQGGYAACILLTADLSEKSRKEVLYFAEKQHVPVVQTDWEMAEVWLLHCRLWQTRRTKKKLHKAVLVPTYRCCMTA